MNLGFPVLLLRMSSFITFIVLLFWTGSMSKFFFLAFYI